MYQFLSCVINVDLLKHKSGSGRIRERGRWLTKVSLPPWKNRNCTNQTAFPPLVDASHHISGGWRSLWVSVVGSTRAFFEVLCDIRVLGVCWLISTSVTQRGQPLTRQTMWCRLKSQRRHSSVLLTKLPSSISLVPSLFIILPVHNHV